MTESAVCFPAARLSSRAIFATFRALGVGHIDFGFGGSSTDEVLTTMKRFRDEVLARV